jgi:hypothetical protein
MKCRDVRDVADSFLGDELLPETNDGILEHLDTCASCQAEIDARRTLRRALHGAFDRAPDLRPRLEFLDQLRGDLRNASAHRRSRGMASGPWFAMAAGLVLAAALTVTVFMKRSTPSDVLAQDAIGDHRNCALKARLVRMPMPLEEAAQRFDGAFRLLLTAPADDVSTPGGPVRVVERHACAYGGRRFGHVVLEYQGHVVSLLLTASEVSTSAADTGNAAPRLIGSSTNGLSVVSVTGSRHAVLLVSDLGRAELTQLSTALSVPLAQHLAARVTDDRGTMASSLIVAALQEPARREAGRR